MEQPKQEVKVSGKHRRLIMGVLVLCLLIAGSSLLLYRYVHAQKKQKNNASVLAMEKSKMPGPLILIGSDVSRNDVVEIDGWVQSNGVDCTAHFYDQLNEIREQLKNRESYLSALELLEDQVNALKPITVDLNGDLFEKNEPQEKESTWLSWLKIKRIPAGHVIAQSVDVERIQTQMLLAVEQLHAQAYRPDQHRMEQIFYRLKRDGSQLSTTALQREIEALSHWQAHALVMPRGLLSCQQQGEGHV